jgi:hypothetical protein
MGHGHAEAKLGEPDVSDSYLEEFLLVEKHEEPE